MDRNRREQAEAALHQTRYLYCDFGRVAAAEQVAEGVFVSETPVIEYGDAIVLTHEATRAAIAAWSQWGNIREMHQLNAVGVALEITADDDARTGRLAAKIVDAPAWEKIRAGVYKGFSVGYNPKRWEISDNWDDPIRVTEYEIVEVSLVDRPADPTAKIEAWRAAPAGPAAETVLGQVWRALLGGVPVPETVDEALTLARAALRPQVEPGPTAEHRLAALEERLAQFDQPERLARLEARVAALEAQPQPLPVVTRGSPATGPERMAELQRTIAERKLAPDAPEVGELMRLYQQMREGGAKQQ